MSGMIPETMSQWIKDLKLSSILTVIKQLIQRETLYQIKFKKQND
jgi:hypothetical protein